MAKGTTTTTENTTSSSTRPWAEAMPVVNNIIGGLSSYDAGPTAGQTSAGADLVKAANGIPDLSASEIGAVKNLFSSDTRPQQGWISDAFDSLKGTMGGYLDPSYLDPTKTPGFSDALSTLKGDITNSITGQFAAAGRDFSPAASTALARGLVQGGGGLISDQFNKNVNAQQNAATSLLTGANSAASGVSNLQQVPLMNGIQGLQAASGLGGLLTMPAATRLAAENTFAGIPLTNYANLEALGLPIAQLGSNTTGTSRGTSTVEQPLGPQIVGGLLGAAGVASKFFNPIGGLLGSAGSTFIGNPWGSSGVGGVPRAGLDF